MLPLLVVPVLFLDEPSRLDSCKLSTEQLSELLLVLVTDFIDVLLPPVFTGVLLEKPSRLVSCNVSKLDWNDCLFCSFDRVGSIPVSVGTSIIFGS